MVISHMQLKQLHVFSGSIFKKTGCAGIGFWPSLIKLFNFGRTWVGWVVVSRREANIDQTPRYHNCSNCWSPSQVFCPAIFSCSTFTYNSENHQMLLCGQSERFLIAIHCIWNIIDCTVKYIPCPIKILEWTYVSCTLVWFYSKQ